MSLVHDGYKIWYTYKGVLCQYLDGVNYDYECLSLHTTMAKCQKKHPDCMVWYEVVNVYPFNAPNGKVYKNCKCICDIRVVYAPKQLCEYTKIDKTVRPKVSLLTVRKDDGNIHMGKYIIKKLTDGKYSVDKSAFVGTLEECKKYVEYVRQAPQCYKDRAERCINWSELFMRTDIGGGKCVCTKYTAEKNHKYDINFRYKMHKGSAYLMY